MAKPLSSQTQAGSYLERFIMAPQLEAKIDIAVFVADKLIRDDDVIFVASGTTAAITGIQVLATRPEVRIHTHSIPLAWHVMEFVHRKEIENPTIEMVSGTLNAITGIVQNTKLGKLHSKVFIYAPHAIGTDGVSGVRDVEYLKAAWQAHERIILLATYDKVLRDTAKVIKHIGHIKKEKAGDVRSCELVIPDLPPRGISAAEKARADKALLDLKSNGVVVHRAKRAKDSVWHAYVKEATEDYR